MIYKILIVGLGNPGKKYELTRHNAGFIFLDFFKNEFFSHEIWKTKYNGEFISSVVNIDGIQITTLLLKPQTFMNLSGNSVCSCIQKESIPLENVIILHDDIEIPFKEIRWKMGGGHKGHNGLRDIIQKCGANFCRIRIGVGRPTNSQQSVAEYLLSNFNKSEQEQFLEIYNTIKDMILNYLNELKKNVTTQKN